MAFVLSTEEDNNFRFLYNFLKKDGSVISIQKKHPTAKTVGCKND